MDAVLAAHDFPPPLAAQFWVQQAQALVAGSLGSWGAGAGTASDGVPGPAALEPKEQLDLLQVLHLCAQLCPTCPLSNTKISLQ